MDNIKICSECQKVNPADATICAHCGTALVALLPAPSTIIVPDQPLKFPPPEHIAKLVNLYLDTLVLMVVGQEQPIVLKGSVKVTLGRFSSGETSPSIDLTPYNADMLGVSRQHARITRVGEAYIIEDLSSTNGTWLNENRLAPLEPYELHNGALIRLGQLGLYAYFSAAATAEDTLVLKNGISAGKLTPHNLTSDVAPYLSAISGIQTVCAEILARKSPNVSIRAITVDENGSISIKLEGAKESIQFTREKLRVWRVKYKSQLSKLREMNKTTTSSSEGDSALNETEIENLRLQLADAEFQLGTDYLTDLASDRSIEDRSQYLTKLLPHLHTLTFSPLQAIID